MQFMDDSLLPENQDPLVIQVAPYAPSFLPRDSDEFLRVQLGHVRPQRGGQHRRPAAVAKGATMSKFAPDSPIPPGAGLRQILIAFDNDEHAAAALLCRSDCPVSRQSSRTIGHAGGHRMYLESEAGC